MFCYQNNFQFFFSFFFFRMDERTSSPSENTLCDTFVLLFYQKKRKLSSYAVPCFKSRLSQLLEINLKVEEEKARNLNTAPSSLKTLSRSVLHALFSLSPVFLIVQIVSNILNDTLFNLNIALNIFSTLEMATNLGVSLRTRRACFSFFFSFPVSQSLVSQLD